VRARAEKRGGLTMDALLEAINAQASVPVSLPAVRAALQTAAQAITVTGNLAKHKHAA